MEGDRGENVGQSRLADLAERLGVLAGRAVKERPDRPGFSEQRLGAGDPRDEVGVPLFGGLQLFPPGGVDVVLRFEVQDTGIGIAAVDQKRLFGLFEQIDDSPTRRHGGAGVGLALSKQLIELMGGSIGVDSQPGGGSVFWFTVRLDKLYRQPCAISNRDSAARVYLDDAARQDRFIGLQEAKALVHQLRLRQAELELECAALRQRVAG